VKLPAELVLASDNPGKLREFQEMFRGSGARLIPQGQFGTPAAVENGRSFAENAVLKARNAAHHSGLPALADDSGLAVDALDGAPGIYSARFAGPGADAEQNNRKLLDLLKETPDAQRSARFCCAVALVRDAREPEPLVAEGAWEGRILQAPQGAGGFGYDPLFFVAECNCSAAELAPAEKHRLSHRGQAVRALLQQLSS